MKAVDESMALLNKALELKALDFESGRYSAGGLQFSKKSGKNYGFDAAVYVQTCGGSVFYTEEDEDTYDSIYEKAAGEYHAGGQKTRERIDKAKEYGEAMKRGFQTLQNYMEDRGHYLYRIQGRGNLVTVITINPDLIVQTRVKGQFVNLPAKDAYEARQVATAEGNIARAVNVISSVSNGSESKVNEVVSNMVKRGIEKAKEKQEARIAIAHLAD